MEKLKRMSQKYKDAKTAEERIAVLSECGIELSDDDLNEISGGGLGFCKWGSWTREGVVNCTSCGGTVPAETRQCFYITGMIGQTRCAGCKKIMKKVTFDFTNFTWYGDV